MSDWPLVLAIGAIAISGLSLLAKLLDKSLSIREHEEYKGQEKQKDELRDTIREEEMRAIRHRLRKLEK